MPAARRRNLAGFTKIVFFKIFLRPGKLCLLLQLIETTNLYTSRGNSVHLSMQRTAAILAYVFILITIGNVTCFSQQYPFVHYTPKDGLINSRVKSIRQDSKGRMLFVTLGGLSIYDGTRFMNYSQQDGLADDLVNDIIETGNDTLLVATNVKKLNTIINGQIGVFKTADNFYPITNQFLKSPDGNLYVAADEGLFILAGSKFIHLPVLNKEGIDVGMNFANIEEWEDLLFLTPWSNLKERLIVYNKTTRSTVAISTDRRIGNVLKDHENRLWVAFTEGMKLLDTVAIKIGKLNLLDPPPVYSFVSHIRNANFFSDKNNDLWVNADGQLKIFSLKAPRKLIPVGDNLTTFTLTDIMQDREGSFWIATDGKGVFKWAGTNVQVLSNFLPGQQTYISAIQQQGDTTWFLNLSDNTVLRSVKNEIQAFPLKAGKLAVFSVYPENKNLYLVDHKKIYCVKDKNKISSYRNPEVIFQDSTAGFGSGVIDPYGAIITYNETDTGSYLFVIKGNKKLMEYKISLLGDQLAFDKAGRLWMVNRLNHMLVFTLHPEDPSHYLQVLKDLTKQIPDMDPRSLTIDTNNNVWVGTRSFGLFCLKFDDLTFRSATQFTTKNGLTDNFIYYLTCDNKNVIWVGTQTGLDKIFFKNDRYIIGNISKTNNFFQSILKIIATKDSVVWALTNEGTVLKIANSSPSVSSLPEPALLTSLKVNGQLFNDHVSGFSYRQNNLTFNVAAPSFINEKSIMYSYLLKGSGNNNWSEPSNNSVFNFINLPPGNYVLQIRSDFPELMYPSQTFSYQFSIRPPSWQTWWFRTATGLFIVGLLIAGFRFYYRRKFEKQRMILEKQQAVEQERNRIAADIHDDLGAGLTNIKYITENILEKTESGETVKPELERLKSFSSELVESMGEIIWAVSEKNNLLSDTLYYLRSYALNYCEEVDIDCHFDIPENFTDRSVSGNMRRNIFLLMKESLHNIVKHAGATTINIKATVNGNLELTIKDDGKGFSENGNSAKGNGLINMRKRVKELNGIIHFENKNGTTVTIDLPFTPNQSTID